jgi:hypothetical protein
LFGVRVFKIVSVITGGMKRTAKPVGISVRAAPSKHLGIHDKTSVHVLVDLIAELTRQTEER